jgi:hypothetical protein
MRKPVTDPDRKHSLQVTQAALMAIDAIKRRRQPGLRSDKDIAGRLLIPGQTIHYWRNHERAITVYQLVRLTLEFDVNPVWLLKQEGSPFAEAELMLKIQALEERQNEMEVKLKQLELLVGKKSGTGRVKNGKN